MPETISIAYVGPSQAVYVSDLGIEVKRGAPVDVPAVVAGREPGDWQPRTEDTPEGWPTRPAADGSTVEACDPGEGLLAQPGNWVPADQAAAPVVEPAPFADASADPTPLEG